MLSIIDSLIGPVSTILDKIVVDKDVREKLAHEIATMSQKHHQQIMLAQLEINKADARGNWFQSSWRPATAWVCVAGFTVNFLISPLAVPFGIEIPQTDTAVMMPVLLGLLGLTGARSYERVKGVGK
tara:strand:- start:273 stop:653 length:381 start_codon:yes stop_codon:yes gene_type:complete